MSQVSGFYNSNDTVYLTGHKKQSSKEKHGDVKHIVFKDGQPLYSEVIPIRRKKKSDESPRKESPRKIAKSTSKQNSQQPKVISDHQKSKLADRLNDVIRKSLTIWSAKTGYYLSYQGNQNFLVKQFSPTNRVLSERMMTKAEILSGEIPEIFGTTWKKV